MNKRASWADLDGSDISTTLGESSRRTDTSEMDRSDMSRQSYTDEPMARRSSWGDLDAVLEQFETLSPTTSPAPSDEEKPRKKKSHSSKSSVRSSTSSRTSVRCRREELKRKISKRRSLDNAE